MKNNEGKDGTNDDSYNDNCEDGQQRQKKQELW
jgi:hypothetical protein